MNETTTGDFTLAIEHLREDLAEHRTETRNDIKALEAKTDKWQDEVRGEFGAVKSRLDIIETKITTKEQDTEKSFGHLTGVLGLVVAIATAIVMWIKGG